MVIPGIMNSFTGVLTCCLLLPLTTWATNDTTDSATDNPATSTTLVYNNTTFDTNNTDDESANSNSTAPDTTLPIFSTTPADELTTLNSFTTIPTTTPNDLPTTPESIGTTSPATTTAQTSTVDSPDTTDSSTDSTTTISQQETDAVDPGVSVTSTTSSPITTTPLPTSKHITTTLRTSSSTTSPTTTTTRTSAEASVPDYTPQHWPQYDDRCWCHGILGLYFMGFTLISMLCIVVTTYCAFKIGSRRMHFDPMPIGPVGCRRARGIDLASDKECKSSELNSAALPTFVSGEAGWCIPLQEEKKDIKQTEDTGF